MFKCEQRIGSNFTGISIQNDILHNGVAISNCDWIDYWIWNAIDRNSTMQLHTNRFQNVDKSNWLLIVEYDFDNNRHGFVAFIQSSDWKSHPVQGMVFYKFRLESHKCHEHTHGTVQFNNKLNYGLNILAFKMIRINLFAFSWGRREAAICTKADEREMLQP